MSLNEVTVKSPINIALLKYWGKLEKAMNIPLNGSFSFTLSREDIYSLTKMKFSKEKIDSFKLFDMDGNLFETKLPKNFKLMKAFFTNFAKSQGKSEFFVEIESRNSFPTKAGLASSASGLCSLVLAFSRLLNFFDETEQEAKQDLFDNIKNWVIKKSAGKLEKILAIVLLLRNVSGSSCRSVFLFPVFQIGPELHKDAHTKQQELNEKEQEGKKVLQEFRDNLCKGNIDGKAFQLYRKYALKPEINQNYLKQIDYKKFFDFESE